MAYGDRYEMVCGIETHAEMATKTKIFCACSTEFGAEQNTHVCPVCLGLPGTLPVLNREAVNLAIKAGLALNCQIASVSKFDRKNYYYPDLPKNYQTSQYDMPIAQKGWLEIKTDAGVKKVGITRAHMEEDAGKLIHSGESITSSAGSSVDYNRAGVPLLEIVSEPDMRSPDEALAYLTSLVRILDYAGVSDCKLEQGSVRFDVNLSLRPKGSGELGTRTEMKNLNSFSAVRRCLEYEAERQAAELDKGARIIQETRAWDEERGMTLPLREKEEAHDYRYFPEPDLMPLRISPEWIESARRGLPELPAAKRERLTTLGLSAYDAEVIVAAKDVALYFDEALPTCSDVKMLAGWLTSELRGLLNARDETLAACLVRPPMLASLVNMIKEGTISGKMGKTVLETMARTGRAPEDIARAEGMSQISDAGALAALIEDVLANNPKSVSDYRGGKAQALGFLVGQVMRLSKGQANPALVNQILKEKLN
ncbi:MAG: Asp-tRNA(Asn)/Glu-tRNA(Gln) amidotransferase subunit GatB [Gracilibacteraceae bacterium]|jgi:aspartyl-tRNA(Asn)/glutamyl-tRNA(Gln) amidotransferase subunit B|nr:Asp-tRNA(Asn)/Glu-tRNA(Gln) amidotransferase subunit GatB [Gracilibacteraceae bacterium]